MVQKLPQMLFLLQQKKLPQIDFNNIQTDKIKLIGNTTKESMLSGIILGYASLIDGLIIKIKKEKSLDFKVITTGGLAPIIVPASKQIDLIEKNLTLESLKFF